MRNKVKEKRLKNNLTQEVLASTCGVSRQTINSIENEKYEPTTRLAIKISKSLKTRVEDLFFLEDEEG